MTEEDVVLTGTVTVTLVGSNSKPIRNAKVTLSYSTDTYTGYTDRLGVCELENVIQHTYNVMITHTGYNPVEDTLIVSGDVSATFQMSHLPIDPNTIEVDLDERYTFTVTGQLIHDYSFTSNMIEWLQANLEGLKDDYNTALFGKVNTGFNDSSIKTFGKRPVCDVYINNVEYTGDFDNHYPEKVNSIVIVYLKGANNHTYGKACELHDLLMQEFITNEDFRRLSDVVSDTYITNSELRVQPLQKKWGVIVAFELSHTLY